MKLSSFSRAALVVAGISFAALSQAQVSLIAVSTGMFTFGAPTPLQGTANESVVAMGGGYAPFQTDSWSIGLLPLAGNYVGSGTYVGALGDMTISVSLPATNVVTQNTSVSLTGAWTYVSGTGVYANKAGGGTLAVNLLPIVGPLDFSGTTLSGTLNAVPEPAPLAILGVGAIGLFVRRRKA